MSLEFFFIFLLNKPKITQPNAILKREKKTHLLCRQRELIEALTFPPCWVIMAGVGDGDGDGDGDASATGAIDVKGDPFGAISGCLNSLASGNIRLDSSPINLPHFAGLLNGGALAGFFFSPHLWRLSASPPNK